MATPPTTATAAARLLHDLAEPLRVQAALSWDGSLRVLARVDLTAVAAGVEQALAECPPISEPDERRPVWPDAAPS